MIYMQLGSFTHCYAFEDDLKIVGFYLVHCVVSLSKSMVLNQRVTYQIPAYQIFTLLFVTLAKL